MSKPYTISQLFKTKWEELSESDFAEVLLLTEKIRTVEDRKEYGMLVISVLRVLRKNKALVAKIDVEQAVDCFNDIKFFHRDAKGIFITPWYFFPVRSFKAGGYEFVPPAGNESMPMFNRTFDQLVFAESAWSAFCVMHYQYKQHPTKQLQQDMDGAVNALISVLYQYTDFNVADIDEKALLVGNALKADQKAIILHTYANVRELIINRCPTLFNKASEEVEEDAPEPIPVHTGEMWLNLRYDLAETEVFKGFDRARNALIYDALDYLEKKAKDALNEKNNAKN